MITESDIGHLVRFWRNGWHVGTLSSFNKTTAVIKHAVIRKPLKISTLDCESLQEVEVKGAPEMNIYEHLLKAVESAGIVKQGFDQTDDQYLTSIVRAINKLDEEAWRRLPLPAEQWFNSAVIAINSLQSIPHPSGYIGIDSSQRSTTKSNKEPTKSGTAKEVLKSPPMTRASIFQTTPGSPPKVKRQITGVMDAMRKAVILHPEWTTRQVYDYLRLNGYPEAKLDTISVDGGNIRRVIQIAKELGLWVKDGTSQTNGKSNEEESHQDLGISGKQQGGFLQPTYSLPEDTPATLDSQ
jgi:hypothetical protein